MGALEGDAGVVAGEFVHDVYVIVLGTAASLAFVGVFAAVVGSEDGDACGFELLGGVSIEGSDGVCGVFFAFDGASDGVNDDGVNVESGGEV